MCDLSGVSVILPSLDPDEKLTAVIDGLLEYGFQDIILVNDGSKPENLHYFLDAAALHPEITLLQHEVNRGKGAAMKTAFSWYLENRPDGQGVVTVDGDNQHHPDDTRNCCQKMLETGHIVLGVRDFNQPDVPPRSRSGNKITSAVFKIFVGMVLSDTQTGLRAIPRSYLPLLCTISGDRYEYETNMLLAMKTNRIDFDEVKIRTVYIEENKSSHFHAVWDSWRIYKLILAHFFRYAASSVVSALLDEGLFLMLTALLGTMGVSGIWLNAAATGGARVVSSLANFTLNRVLVFRCHSSLWKSLAKYYALALPTLLAQFALTEGVYTLLHIGDGQVFLRGLIYAVVMAVLFVVNYMIQQRWVFSNPENASKK